MKKFFFFFPIILFFINSCKRAELMDQVLEKMEGNVTIVNKSKFVVSNKYKLYLRCKISKGKPENAYIVLENSEIGELENQRNQVVTQKSDAKIFASDSVFYFTPKIIGTTTLKLQLRDARISDESKSLIRTHSFSYNIGVPKLLLLDMSTITGKRILLEGQTDSMIYYVIATDEQTQKVNTTTEVAGSSLALLKNSVMGSNVATLRTTANQEEGKKISNLISFHPLTHEEAQKIKDRHGIDLFAQDSLKTSKTKSARTSGSVAINGTPYQAGKLVIPFKTLNNASSTEPNATITTTALSSTGGEAEAKTEITVSAENFSVNVIKDKDQVYAMSTGNALDLTLTTNSLDVQTKVNFTYKFSVTKGFEGKIAIFDYNEDLLSKHPDRLPVSKSNEQIEEEKLKTNTTYKLNTIPTISETGSVLVNPWSGLVGEKDESGVLVSSATFTKKLYFILLSEKNVDVTFSVISSAGKIVSSEVITLKAKKTVPNWGGMLFTNKLGLSHTGFISGVIDDQFSLHIDDENPNSNFEFKIKFEYIDGSSGLFNLEHGGEVQNINRYTPIKKNNDYFLAITRFDRKNRGIQSLVGKYSFTTTFKRNYGDEFGNFEYVRRDTLEIYEDRIAVDFMKYGSSESALNSNLEITTMESDVPLYSFDIISEQFKSSYRNYTIKIECEGDPVDIALTKFKANVYELVGRNIYDMDNGVYFDGTPKGNIREYQTLELGKEYLIGNRGEHLMHIKVDPVRYSLERSNRFIQNVKVTIKNTRNGAEKTYSLGSLRTLYQNARINQLFGLNLYVPNGSQIQHLKQLKLHVHDLRSTQKFFFFKGSEQLLIGSDGKRHIDVRGKSEVPFFLDVEFFVSSNVTKNGAVSLGTYDGLEPFGDVIYKYTTKERIQYITFDENKPEHQFCHKEKTVELFKQPFQKGIYRQRKFAIDPISVKDEFGNTLALINEVTVPLNEIETDSHIVAVGGVELVSTETISLGSCE